MPPTLGTKIMPMGDSCAIICASCPAPLGSRRLARPRRPALSSMAFCASKAALAGVLEVTDLNSIDVLVALAISAAHANLLGKALDLFSRQIAEFDHQSDEAGNHVGEFGVTSRRPTVPTCRPGTEFTTSRTAMVRYEAASRASCRSAIAVVPA